MRARFFPISLLLVTIVASACGAAKTPFPEMVTLKVTISPVMSYAPLLIANVEGYFADYGIKIDEIKVAKSSEAIALFATGKVDVFAGVLSAGFLNTVYSEKNIKVVADRGHISKGAACTYWAIVIRKDLFENGKVKNPADLKGLTFSTSASGPSGYLVSTYMSQAGLTLKDLTIKNLDTPSEIQAFDTKAIDGSTTPEPDLTNLLDGGNSVILAKAEDVLGTFQSGIIAFNTNLLVDQPGVGARFLAGYLKGVQQYNQGKTDRNLQILSQATGETVENLKRNCWTSISKDGKIDFAGVEGFQKWSIANDQLANPVTEEQFWDPSFLAAAQKLIKP